MQNSERKWVHSWPFRLVVATEFFTVYAVLFTDWRWEIKTFSMLIPLTLTAVYKWTGIRPKVDRETLKWQTTLGLAWWMTLFFSTYSKDQGWGLLVVWLVVFSWAAQYACEHDRRVFEDLIKARHPRRAELAAPAGPRQRSSSLSEIRLAWT